MITQYRSAYNIFYKAPTFSGRSIDTKPVSVENGAVYKEIDTGAHDAYNTGDKVSYNGKHYICPIDANTYAPDVHGWEET